MDQVIRTLGNKYPFSLPHTSLLKWRTGLLQNVVCAKVLVILILLRYAIVEQES